MKSKICFARTAPQRSFKCFSKHGGMKGIAHAMVEEPPTTRRSGPRSRFRKRPLEKDARLSLKAWSECTNAGAPFDRTGKEFFTFDGKGEILVHPISCDVKER
mmetsp:Transcript_76783/g.121268  ORF Transcript_76783/g.121268 Transcript_76783/m.121268 type:complete len:103 (+) Transcript_76783:1031-1339(+)